MQPRPHAAHAIRSPRMPFKSERCAAPRLEDLEAWITERLDNLERQFADFITPRSLRRSIGRNPQER